MKKQAILAVFAALVLVLSISLPARPAGLPTAEAQDKAVELTVYNQDMALVRESRTIPLAAGVNEVTYSDVAAQIDPTSVSFRSLTDPLNTVVLEQNFEYDIVGSDKLLQKYIDREIVVQTEDSKVYTGTLLSGAGDVILQAADGSLDVLKYDQIRSYSFPALPEGLRTKPSLVWLVDAQQAGDHDTETTYLTNGISWQADYVMLLNEDSTSFDLDGWVTLDNRSGANYEEATLKLVAGDINVVREEEVVKYMVMEAAAAYEPPAPQVEQREFFEYHLYQVQRPVTVKDQQTKQIEFVNGVGVPATRFYVYEGAQGYSYWGSPITDPGYGAQTGNTDVTVMLEFRTDAASGLETQLPAGRVRMYQEDVDGSPLLVGEDQIDHTPQDETVRLTVGNAFDVKGERVQTNYKQLGDSGAEESYQITLRNHKDEPIEVRIVERMYRSNQWEITAEQVDGAASEHTKLDSQTAEWRVTVPADGEAALEYTVQYLWK
jgi:hypothetical protein